MKNSDSDRPDSDGMIETPINLVSVDKPQLLFYLAANTPLSIASLAEDCTTGSSSTKSILRDRFRAEINIDMTDTVRLSGDARRAVIRGSKPLITSGQDQLRRGKSYASRDDYTEAADCFAQAVSILQKVNGCYDAVNHESSKLEQLITTTKDRHDSAASEAAKDSINYYVLHATQHESEGDKHSKKKPSRAAENYQKATNQLSQALETAKECNQSMWQDSSNLSLQPIKEKLSKVSEKLDSIGDTSSTSSTESSGDSADSTAEERTSAGYSDQELINALQQLALKLDESPRPEFVNKYGEYPADPYIECFGSWEDALAAASLDPINQAARERRTYSRLEILDALANLIRESGSTPSRTEMNRKGAVSSTTVTNRFDSWDAALNIAQSEIASNTTEQQNEAESQEQHGSSNSTTKHSVTGHSSNQDKTHYYGNKPDTDPNVSSKASASSAGRNRKAMLQTITNLYNRLGRVPKTTEIPEDCEYSPNNFYKEFGSWDEALKAAGIDKQQEMLDDIERVSKEIGDVPKSTDMDEYGVYSGASYSSYFDSWSAALEQSEVVVNHEGQQSNSSQSSPQVQKASTNQIPPGALDTSWETIPENERISGQFLLQVTDVEQLNGDRKTARLSVRDKNGRKFDLNIWSKHDIDQDWREGQWYALENARGKVWESSNGTTQKQLSSTKDLKVTKLTKDFDPNVGSVKGTSESVSQPQRSSATTSGDVREPTSDTTVSNRDSAAGADQQESSEDGSPKPDNDGILDDIMSDFDEV